MRKLFFTLCCAMLAAPAVVQAQTNCLFDETAKNYQQTMQQASLAIAQKSKTANSARKTTAAPDTIPVVFHVVLTNTQLNYIDGIPGLERRIASQLEVLNRDFNGKNADSVNIPDAFKPVFGGLNLYFGLAHTDDSGNYSPGYTLTTATQNYFDYAGTAGSGSGASDAKYSTSGGADAWNPDHYLNIWIINIKNTSTGQISAGVSSIPTMGIYPKEEWGIALNYGALGRREKTTDYFMNDADSGRTIIHEAGHFFGLLHTWGLSLACGTDDNIDDTPPQEIYTNHICPKFPLTDACSPDSPGVMYMNFMDFASQECQLMFTDDQSAYMNTVRTTYYPKITAHPELLRPPVGTSIKERNSADVVKIYPNPSNGKFQLGFANEAPEEMIVSDGAGRVLISERPAKNANGQELDMSALPKGVYYLQLRLKNDVLTRKLLLQ